MENILDEVDRRSKLALSNQMEMLIFYLNDEQIYGINVFKIIEILECPSTMTKIPHAHPSIKGTIDFRGKAVVVIDLGDFLGMTPLDYKNNICYIIVCEYNNVLNSFLIKQPDNLITRGWEQIKNPSGMLTQAAYLTAIAYTDDGETIQLLDIEKILAEILGLSTDISEYLKKESGRPEVSLHNILIVDDSKTARESLKSVLDQIGIHHTEADSAVSAFQLLENIYKKDGGEKFSIIISDIEMPGMDGFTFVRKIRETPQMAGLYVILHSSLSNPSNQEKATLVGADDFIAKFQPDILAEKILAKIRQ